jgi:hypothetical protein
MASNSKDYYRHLALWRSSRVEAEVLNQKGRKIHFQGRVYGTPQAMVSKGSSQSIPRRRSLTDDTVEMPSNYGTRLYRAL